MKIAFTDWYGRKQKVTLVYRYENYTRRDSKYSHPTITLFAKETYPTYDVYSKVVSFASQTDEENRQPYGFECSGEVEPRNFFLVARLLQLLSKNNVTHFKALIRFLMAKKAERVFSPEGYYDFVPWLHRRHVQTYVEARKVGLVK